MSNLSKRTSHHQTLGGVPCLIPNKTDEVKTGSKHWYISYNNHDIGDYGSDTTALVLGQMEYFIVLNGDHRKQFQEVIDDHSECWKTGLKKCLDYVRKNKKKLNKMSDKLI
jgi:hypothetical protein